MNFKKWYLNEVGTGANMVAVFARPIGSTVTREWPPVIAGSKEEGEECKRQGKPGGVTALGYGCGDGKRK